VLNLYMLTIEATRTSPYMSIGRSFSSLLSSAGLIGEH
jgi:hypothetical protein